MTQIVLHVKNGIVSVESMPENVELIIKDFDVPDMKCYIETVTMENGEILYGATHN